MIGGGRIKSVDWWNEHQNSPGMDAPSMRCLMYDLKAWKKEHDEVRDQCVTSGHVTIWDEAFAEQNASVVKAMTEIEARLGPNA